MKCLVGAMAVFTAMISAPGCASEPEEGTFPCTVDSECPATWVCRSDDRCWRTPDGTDADVPDAGRDAATPDVPDLDAPASTMDSGGEPDGGGELDGGFDSPNPMDASGLDAPMTDTPTVDTGIDGGSDAGDGGTDAGVVDGGTDAGTDAGGPCGGLPYAVFYRDLDGDGYGAASSGTAMRCTAGAGYVSTNDDCDDGDPARAPSAIERCNNMDDNCDGSVDGAVADADCVVSNGTGICEIGGVCVVDSCDSFYDDCDGVAATGCETNLRTSAPNCGRCGSSCGVGDTCVDGSCATSRWVQTSTWGSAACARRENGFVGCWGQNFSGIVNPYSSGGTYSLPNDVGISDAIDIAVNATYACAVRLGGTVSCWGSIPYGGSILSPPVNVAGISDAVDIAAAVARFGGIGTTCAVRANGRIACWGGNALLGDGTPNDGGARATAGGVAGITDAAAIVGGSGAFCTRRATGAVACWAAATEGSTYCGGSGSECPTPVSISIGGTATQIFSAGNSFFALRTDGAVVGWGSGPNPDYAASVVYLTPTPVRVVAMDGLVAVGGGGNDFCMGNPTSACWGILPGSDVLPLGPTSVVFRPVEMVSGRFFYATDVVGRIWSWDRQWATRTAPAVFLGP